MTFRDYSGMGDVSFPAESKPFIMKNIDGPLLQFSDGQLHWLTWRERFQVWRGKIDAEGLQRKLRPKLTAELEYFWRNRGSK